MGFLKELLAKQRYPVILLFAGVMVLFAANYSVSGELTKPKLTPTRPQLMVSILGILTVLGSTVLFLIEEDFVAYRRGCKIHTTESGFKTKFRDSEGWRSAFRIDVDHDSEVMPISNPN
jgi:hypothetical protein